MFTIDHYRDDAGRVIGNSELSTGWRNIAYTNNPLVGAMPVGVEKLFSKDFANKIRRKLLNLRLPQAAEIH